jgi:midasin
MGLGEGEGEKDVSEQIESEEQLEDARPKGEESTEDHEDCKACLRLINCNEVQ